MSGKMVMALIATALLAFATGDAGPSAAAMSLAPPQDGSARPAIAAASRSPTSPVYDPRSPGTLRYPAAPRIVTPQTGNPSRSVGWCQCIDDRTVIQAMCQPSAETCQAACTGGHFSFLPYAQQTCAVR